MRKKITGNGPFGTPNIISTESIIRKGKWTAIGPAALLALSLGGCSWLSSTATTTSTTPSPAQTVFTAASAPERG